MRTTYLLEADISRVLPETLPAQVQTILPDKTVSVSTRSTEDRGKNSFVIKTAHTKFFLDAAMYRKATMAPLFENGGT